MALRKIFEIGDPCLNKVCRPVTAFNRRLHILLDDMKETLLHADGAGLAAPQVGILRRVCIINLSEEHIYVELINPEIVSQSGEQEGIEGCLSVPGRWGLVKRPEFVQIRHQDRDGNWHLLDGDGLAARTYCHEIEHLDGHLYVEHIDHFLSEKELEKYTNEEKR